MQSQFLKSLFIVGLLTSACCGIQVDRPAPITVELPLLATTTVSQYAKPSVPVIDVPLEISVEYSSSVPNPETLRLNLDRVPMALKHQIDFSLLGAVNDKRLRIIGGQCCWAPKQEDIESVKISVIYLGGDDQGGYVFEANPRFRSRMNFWSCGDNEVWVYRNGTFTIRKFSNLWSWCRP